MNPALLALLGQLLDFTVKASAAFAEIKSKDPAAWKHISEQYPDQLAALKLAEPKR